MPAGLAIPTVDIEPTCEIAELAIGSGVIAQCRPTVCDRLLENLADRRQQTSDLRSGYLPARLARIDPRAPKRFADIDISQTGDHALVEHQELDRRLSPFDGGSKMVGRQAIAKRLGAECGDSWPVFQLNLVHKVDRAESSRVVQGQPMMRGLDHKVIVLAQFGRIDPPSPAHAQVKDQSPAPIGVDQPIFGAAPQPSHPRARKRLHKIGGKGAAKVGAAHVDAHDLFALEDLRETAHRGFDFGKFWHIPCDVAKPTRRR